MTARQIGHSIATGIRWSARILGPVTAALCVYCLLRPDAPILEALARSGLAGTLLYLVIAVAIGVSAGAWWREVAGGLIAFSGGVLILVLAHSGSGGGIPLAAFVLTLPLLFTGFAHLLGALLSRVVGDGVSSPSCAMDGSKWAAAGRV